MRIALLLFCLLQVGCTSGGGARWYAPATWFSSTEGKAVDKADAKVDATQETLLKEAQKSAHRTGVALETAPTSKEVDLARSEISETTTLLDQAVGPLTLSEKEKIIAQVAGLLSENEELRKAIRDEREKDRAATKKLSEKHARAQEYAARAHAQLKEAFVRENALADEARAANAIKWIAIGGGVLAGAAYLYLRFMVGGIPSAVGQAMRTIRTNHPNMAPQVESIFDSLLNRNEQSEIRKHAQ